MKRMQDLERRAEAERADEEERSEHSDSSEGSFIVGGDDYKLRTGDEPVAADEMSKNIFETDTPLFSCQCSKGKEREVVCDIMAKYASPHLLSKCLRIIIILLVDISLRWPTAVGTKFVQHSSTTAFRA